ncbi:MAG TPA: ATP-binding protein [Opitutaceae bacterium]
MKTRSLRFRLILWYAVGLALVFGLATVFLYNGVRHYLETSVSKTQINRAQRIASFLPATEPFPIDVIGARISGDFAPEATSRFIRVTAADGRVLYESGIPVDNSFKPSDVYPAQHTPGTLRQTMPSGAELVIGTIVMRSGTRVQCGESLVAAFKELDRLLITLTLGFAIVAAVALAGGFLLVRRALQPVEEIIGSAENITSRNLSERLPVPSTDDEFRHLSQALNRMITRLDEAFQLNRRFLADASHELRTPLTILRSELETVLQRPDLPEDLRATTGTLFEEVERLVLIVETLFALSRFDTGEANKESARFDLAKLAFSTAEQMELLAEDKKVSLQYAASAPVLVDGDRARLKQVVVNLLDNAIKYTPEGGSVTLSVRSETTSGDSEITTDGRSGITTTSSSHNYAVLEVKDTGMGIPVEAQGQVFNRFFRVDQARNRDAGGAGIGLAIVKAICAAHEGKVEVESELGKGSTFRVKLPLARP